MEHAFAELVSLAKSSPTPITTSDNMCGACVSKTLTCMKIYLYKQNGEVKETDISGYIVV